MKNILFLSFAMAFLSCVVSCNKELTEIEDSSDMMESHNIDVFDLVKRFDPNIAVFENEQQLQNFLVAYYSLGSTEKSTLIESLPFETVDQTIQESYIKMNDFSTAQEFYDEVSKFKGMLEIKLNEQSEEEIYESGLTLHMVRPFLNEDLLIKVGLQYYKYIENYLVTSSEREELADYNSKEDVITSGIFYKLVYGDDIEISFSTSPSTRSDLGATFTQETIKNPRWCQNDRKLIYTCRNIPESVGPFDNWMASSEMRPKKKGIPCIWYNYRTRLIWENYEHDFERFENNSSTIVDWEEADFDDEVFFREYTLLVGFDIDINDFDFEWVNRKSDATSRGIDPLWLNVNFVR